MTAPWWRLGVRCPAADADLVAGWLVMQTGQGVSQPAPDEIVAMVSSRAEARRLAGTLASRFNGVQAAVSAEATVDWSVRWRDGIAPRTFGRLTITPSWVSEPVPPGTAAIIIDPGAAFGSGEHGSTRGALALLERWLQPGGVMLDFGSGSGILAIAAAALGARHAVGIDSDPEAQPVAEANASVNGLAAHCTFLTGDAGELGPLAGPASLLCSNILRDVNIALFPAVRQSLAPGGVAIFAGMEESRGDAAAAGAWAPPVRTVRRNPRRGLVECRRARPMTDPRVLVAPGALAIGATAALDDEEQHHARVRRLRPGRIGRRRSTRLVARPRASLVETPAGLGRHDRHGDPAATTAGHDHCGRCRRPAALPVAGGEMHRTRGDGAGAAGDRAQRRCGEPGSTRHRRAGAAQGARGMQTERQPMGHDGWRSLHARRSRRLRTPRNGSSPIPRGRRCRRWSAGCRWRGWWVRREVSPRRSRRSPANGSRPARCDWPRRSSVMKRPFWRRPC